MQSPECQRHLLKRLALALCCLITVNDNEEFCIVFETSRILSPSSTSSRCGATVASGSVGDEKHLLKMPRIRLPIEDAYTISTDMYRGVTVSMEGKNHPGLDTRKYEGGTMELPIICARPGSVVSNTRKNVHHH